MKNLKSLVSKANSGFSPRSSSNKRFGLGSFIAASSDQMLMTRGGYGGSVSSDSIFLGGLGNGQGFGNILGGRAGTNGAGGSSGTGSSRGGKYTPDQHHMNPSTGNTSSSRIPGYYNIAVKAVGEWLTPDNIIGVFTSIGGKLFSTQSTGSNADCPPGNSNPRCPNSNP
jgi:hypothetical protein